MTLNKDLEKDLEYVMSLLKLELGSKLIAQGRATSQTSSELIKSIEPRIKSLAFLLVGEMYMNDYWIYVEKGVKGSKVPYGGRKTGKKVSKYIQALIGWFRLRRGLGQKQAKRAAFATANVHKKEGIPSRNSFRFSKDGTRLGFVDSTLKKYEQKIQDLMEERTGDSVEKAFFSILTDVQSILTQA